MTEEEKKEFEEFLQWKAEKAKHEEAKQEENVKSSESDEEPQIFLEEKVEESTPVSQNSNTTFIVLALSFVTIIIIFGIVLGIGKKQPVQTPSETIDTIATPSIKTTNVIPRFEATNTYDAKQDSIDRVKRIDELKKTIKIKSSYLGRPNSASGVDAYFYYKNVSDKTIKYL